jgi:Arc/MetJ family transcription regulator
MSFAWPRPWRPTRTILLARAIVGKAGRRPVGEPSSSDFENEASRSARAKVDASSAAVGGRVFC